MGDGARAARRALCRHEGGVVILWRVRVGRVAGREVGGAADGAAREGWLLQERRTGLGITHSECKQ